MKRSRILLVFVIAAVALSSCRKVPRSGKVDFQSQNDSVSYALGYIEANNFKKNFDKYPFEMDSIAKVKLAKALAETKLAEKYRNFRIKQFETINDEIFYKGFINELAYGKSYFSEMSADMFLRKVYGEINARKDSIRKELGKANLAKGVKFLEENGKRKEVKQTESGLQYEILKDGNGPKPEKKSQVKCVYHGTLLDGTVFDSSKERGDTTAFYVNRVVKGWTEALQLMPEGSKWRVYLPAELAYGERGSGDKIGPNEALIFDIDLVEVVKKK